MVWLKTLLEAELLALQMGHLPFSPNDDKFDANLGYWYESFTTALGFIKNDKIIEIDRARIKAAFKKVRPSLERWPTPKQVIEHMPRRPEQAYISHDPRHGENGGSVLSKMSQALVDLSEERINKQEFDKLMDELGGKT
jgi:hypothetical protein